MKSKSEHELFLCQKEKNYCSKTDWIMYLQFQFSSVQSLSRVWLFATPWIAARQASLSITNSQSLRSLSKLMPIESVMPSSQHILCRPLLLLPPIPPSIRVFSNESTLPMKWPKYWSFSFSISPSSEHPGLISFRTYNLGNSNCIKICTVFLYNSWSVPAALTRYLIHPIILHFWNWLSNGSDSVN